MSAGTMKQFILILKKENSILLLPKLVIEISYGTPLYPMTSNTQSECIERLVLKTKGNDGKIQALHKIDGPCGHYMANLNVSILFLK